MGDYRQTVHLVSRVLIQCCSVWVHTVAETTQEPPARLVQTALSAVTRPKATLLARLAFGSYQPPANQKRAKRHRGLWRT